MTINKIISFLLLVIACYKQSFALLFFAIIIDGLFTEEKIEKLQEKIKELEDKNADN